jgi:hypothetical protein
MTLAEAEQDERFDNFKFCSMIDLAQYIIKASIYLGKKEDAEVREFYTAACLIRDKRIGQS